MAIYSKGPPPLAGENMPALAHGVEGMIVSIYGRVRVSPESTGVGGAGGQVIQSST